MAVYDLEEQEQLDALKAWWRRYGNAVSLAVLAGALAFAGVQGWRYWQNRQASEASALYDQLANAADAGDAAKVHDIAGVLAEKYPRTGFAALAALVSARVAADGKDLADAQSSLQWLVNHARDEPTHDLAQLRLAAVLLDLGKQPEALTLTEAKHAGAWDALYAAMKGDVLAAQGRKPEARAAYQQALDKTPKEGAQRPLLQAKLDTLGADK